MNDIMLKGIKKKQPVLSCVNNKDYKKLIASDHREYPNLNNNKKRHKMNVIKNNTDYLPRSHLAAPRPSREINKRNLILP